MQSLSVIGCCLVTKFCLILCDPMGYRVHGTLQARKLEWVAFPFSKGSSQPRDLTQVSHTVGNSLPAKLPENAKNTGMGSISILHWMFPTQESNWGLLHYRWILYQLSFQGSLFGWNTNRNYDFIEIFFKEHFNNTLEMIMNIYLWYYIKIPKW